jgi:hypothetical protein
MHSSLHAWDNEVLKKPRKRLKTAQRKLERTMAGPLTEENEIIAKEQAALVELYCIFPPVCVGWKEEKYDQAAQA